MPSTFVKQYMNFFLVEHKYDKLCLFSIIHESFQSVCIFPRKNRHCDKYNTSFLLLILILLVGNRKYPTHWTYIKGAPPFIYALGEIKKRLEHFLFMKHSFWWKKTFFFIFIPTPAKNGSGVQIWFNFQKNQNKTKKLH